MSGRRWSRWLGPPAALAALVALALVVGALQPGAETGTGMTARPAGACVGASPLGAAAHAVPGAWWRLVDRLDPSGSLIGRTLFAGIAGSAAVTLDLGAESMASGPVGGLVGVATDDGQVSDVRLVSTVDGCSWLMHRSRDVVRSVILDTSTGSLLAHLVSRETRNDLGTWRIKGMDPTATREQVLGPLPPQPALGPIWATALRIDTAGKALAVQSCGEGGCVTRILGLEGPDVTPAFVGGPDQGSMIGFTGKRVVTWAYCQGLPCPVQAWEVGGAPPVTLVAQAAAAALTADDRYLVAVLDETGRASRVDLRSLSSQRIEGVAAGEMPLAPGAGADAGFEVGPDEIALGSAGADPRAFSPARAAPAP